MAAQTNGTATATIVDAIAIAGIAPLDFGSVGNAANVITVSPAGVRSATDSSQLAGGAPQAASFLVKGEISSGAFTVTLPESATILNGSVALTVNNFTHDAPPAMTLGQAGFNVGADLIIGGGEPLGAYTGTFTVTVNY